MDFSGLTFFCFFENFNGDIPSDQGPPFLPIISLSQNLQLYFRVLLVIMNESVFSSNTVTRVNGFLVQLSVQTDDLQVSFPSMNNKIRLLPFFFNISYQKKLKISSVRQKK